MAAIRSLYLLAFLAGALIRLTLADAVGAFSVAAVLLALVGWTGGKAKDVTCVLLWAGAGWLLAWNEAREQLLLRWPESRAGERVRVEAVIESIPVIGPRGVSFDASIRVLAPASDQHTLQTRLQWRDHFTPLHAGERWQFLLSLQPPRSHINPGSLDMELHLFREHIHALGAVIESRWNHRLDGGHRPLAALRERIVARIDHRVMDRDAAALIAALAVGATGSMSREQWRVFSATGTTHLVAISGLHVTLFAWIALALARWIWRAGAWRLLPVPRESFAACLGLTASTGYALLSGFSVPTQRTLVMLAVWLLARTSARACGPITTLGAALIAVLLLDPFAPLAAGFWLSFGAIAAIVLITHGRAQRRGPLHEVIAVQAAVSLALTPVTLACFGSAPLAGLPVNFAAIPFFSFVLVPLVLASIVLMPCGETLSGLVLDCAAALHEMSWPVLTWAAERPFAMIYAAPPLWWYGAATLAIAVSLLPLPMRLRVACLLWLLPTAAVQRAPSDGELEGTILDVGSGTSIVVRTSHHVLVYDVGDVYGGEGRAAEYILLPFLRSEGVRSVDLVALSSAPAESAGLESLLAGMPVKRVIVIGEQSTRAWSWDGVDFRVQCPALVASVSCVMRITTSTGSLLLTGEMDARAEHQLVQQGLAAADIVVIPRHGSDSASSPALIAALAPRWAIVSGKRRVGEKDRPATARWTAQGAEVLATTDTGAIRLRIDPVTGVQSPTAAREISTTLWRVSP